MLKEKYMKTCTNIFRLSKMHFMIKEIANEK